MDSRACTLAGGGTSAAHSCRRQLSQVCTGFCNWQWEAHQLRTAVTDSCHRYAHGFVIGSGRHISCTQLSLTAVAGMHRVLSLAVGGTSAAHSCRRQLSQVCTGFCNWQWEAHQLRTAVADSCRRYAQGFVIGSGRHISCAQLSPTAVAGMHRVL